MSTSSGPASGVPTEAELLGPWTERTLWGIVILVPALCWFNGPSVSPDQAAVRLGTAAVALVAAAALRLRRRSSSS